MIAPLFNRLTRSVFAVATGFALLLHSTAWAQSAAPDPETEVKAAFEAANKTMTRGPADIKLLEQGALKLPEGFVFVPQAEAARLLKAMGNRPGDGLIGLVFPQAEKENWFIVVRFITAGYIKDDDARDWKADDLLTSLREGTEAANADRRARGIPEIEVTGWVEAPAYDAATHRLVWSLASKEKGAPATEERGVNYNTYALGREGYVSMNLVTGMNTVEAEKPTARLLLAALEYNQGKRYGDFNSSTDRVAEYGLAALIGGVAAKKLGLFAVILAFLAKFAKVIGIAVLAFGASAAKWFRGKKTAAGENPPAPPQS